MLLLGTLLLLATAPEGPGVDWNLSAPKIASTCTSELARARSRVKAALAPGSEPAAALERLIAVETAVAELDEALAAPSALADANDRAVRAAASACMESRRAFTVELQAEPSLYALATAAQASARTAADRMLAKRYAEDGRKGGAALEPEARAELKKLLDQLHAEESAFVRAMTQDRPQLPLSAEEAASLPASFARSLKHTPKGVLVPVGLDTSELVLKNLRPSAARERFIRALYRIGGPANVERLRKALALRRKAARLLGYRSWAEHRLDVTSAGTPERALAPALELDAALLPRAREEIAALAALKSAAGEPGPFASWDYAYYQARLEETRFSVDPEAVRQYFPVDHVIPTAISLFEALLGLRFEPVQPASAWAAGVQQYGVRDAASGALLGWAFIDILPREGKLTRPASATFRAGRALPDGRRVLPISAVTGNGPSAAPGERALFTHQGVLEILHELGHLVHALLTTAPYASLSGVNARSDFVEAPSQLFEAWAWDPALLRRLSRHVRTGEPLPEELAARLAGLRRASSGAFWTRQAFLTAYDQALNGPDPVADPTALWFELWGTMTALPPLAGTIPEASLLPQMGGYDATYYGYLWSRIWAHDMATAAFRDGLRFRRMVLEPGATAEPPELIQVFLGRAPQPEAFLESLGLPPRAPAD